MTSLVPTFVSEHYRAEVKKHWDDLVQKYSEMAFRSDTSEEVARVTNDAINLARGAQRITPSAERALSATLRREVDALRSSGAHEVPPLIIDLMAQAAIALEENAAVATVREYPNPEALWKFAQTVAAITTGRLHGLGSAVCQGMTWEQAEQHCEEIGASPTSALIGGSPEASPSATTERNAVIEECAAVVERDVWCSTTTIARALRKLKTNAVGSDTMKGAAQ